MAKAIRKKYKRRKPIEKPEFQYKPGLIKRVQMERGKGEEAPMGDFIRKSPPITRITRTAVEQLVRSIMKKKKKK